MNPLKPSDSSSFGTNANGLYDADNQKQLILTQKAQQEAKVDAMCTCVWEHMQQSLGYWQIKRSVKEEIIKPSHKLPKSLSLREGAIQMNDHITQEFKKKILKIMTEKGMLRDLQNLTYNMYSQALHVPPLATNPRILESANLSEAFSLVVGQSRR